MDETQNLLGKRWIVGVTLLAAEQAQRVLEICATTSGGEKDLNRALREAFDIGELDAEVILSMQVRRFTPASVQRLRAELDEIERQLAIAEA
ncbi:hypothetical protein [Microbacterium alcoholitolerans]|uniref:hypothetical protein n=1 Tax=unclassified Microbacterium TaxID=2609290 RepID=UPI003D1843AB